MRCAAGPSTTRLMTRASTASTWARYAAAADATLPTLLTSPVLHIDCHLHADFVLCAVQNVITEATAALTIAMHKVRHC